MPPIKSLSEFSELEIEQWAASNRPCIGCGSQNPCACHKAGVDMSTRHRIRCALWDKQFAPTPKKNNE